MEVKKIAVKVWQPLINKLDKKMEASCLRRDAYIAKVLSVELDGLDEEVISPNSEAARNFVASKLNLLNRKVITLTLPSDLLIKLDVICANKLIIRDVVFNRIFLMLVATPEQLERLFFGVLDQDWKKLIWDEHLGDNGFFGGMFYPFEPIIDPFFYVREGIQLTNKLLGMNSAFYRLVLTDKIFKNADLYGLNCYLPDELVPETETYNDFLS